MKATIYVEGGGPGTKPLCREGFASYCNRAAPGRSLKIIACGSRSEAFDRFRMAVGLLGSGETCALLVDAELPVPAGLPPVAHLNRCDKWNFAGLPTDRVFLMVQAMEAWFLADRAALANFFGAGFRPGELRGDERNVEAVPKDDLVKCLSAATQGVRVGGGYHKTKRAFALLAQIDPAKVETGSPHAKVFHGFLRSL